jgi:hypothetical protein
MLSARLVIVCTFLMVAPVKAENAPTKHLGALMNMCLTSYNWSSWNVWRFDVYASSGEGVLIGSNDNYFSFSVNSAGFSHIVAGEVVAKFEDVKQISDISPSCDGNCPVNFKKRISWFKRRCKMFS